MHPPDLKMLETNSGLRGSDGSFSGKAQATSSNSTFGISTSQIVIMAGRWIMYDNSAWNFKIDNNRMGRAVDCSTIKGVCGLILAAYGLLGREIGVEMCYWLIDGDSEMVGKGAAPVEIATDTDYKIFKALHRTYKSFNVFVTFREIVGGEMMFLRSERDIFTQTNATAGIVDDDENLIRQVEAIEAAIGLNSEVAEVGGSKDSRAAAVTVCGVNLASENMSQHSCGDQILVERRKNKQANVEAASGDDIGNVAGCAEMDVDKGKGNDYDVGEDEDDGNYDYNYWHEFVSKDCETDEDDDFEGCPPKGRRGGRSDLNGYERCGARGGRGQGSGKPASGRGQRSRATGGSSSSKN
ncbi:hypothetical protein Bca52824_080290 [Brassica carinata]|uniref:Uncharacterized protein n=1 Tax=Brassica carinata TaxID=52824 RepID=A0A8X7TQI1_BRACI|nr:hypothetical protein Bca52824_080290 [Brassica carinata]